MAHSPAFQVYYKDFRQDPKTICMDAVEIGAYWLLIMECWDRDNTLPDDLAELAIIARVPEKKFPKMWESKIRRCFQWDGRRGVFWHKRLDREESRQKEWSQKQSKRGKAGAEAREAKKAATQNSNDSNDLTNSRYAPHNSSQLTPSSSSSFSSSFSSKETELPKAVFIGSVIAGVKKELDLTRLARTTEREWEQQADLAFDNGFSAEQFLECYRNLRETKDYKILPHYVTDQLPEFAKGRTKKIEKLPSVNEVLAKSQEHGVLQAVPKETVH